MQTFCKSQQCIFSSSNIEVLSRLPTFQILLSRTIDNYTLNLEGFKPPKLLFLRTIWCSSSPNICHINVCLLFLIGSKIPARAVEHVYSQLHQDSLDILFKSKTKWSRISEAGGDTKSDLIEKIISWPCSWSCHSPVLADLATRFGKLIATKPWLTVYLFWTFYRYIDRDKSSGDYMWHVSPSSWFTTFLKHLYSSSESSFVLLENSH